jgi:hypothetical protein
VHRWGWKREGAQFSSWYWRCLPRKKKKEKFQRSLLAA